MVMMRISGIGSSALGGEEDVLERFLTHVHGSKDQVDCLGEQGYRFHTA